VDKQNRNRRIKKIALVLSLCAILLWAVLGTGASLAWFTDTSTEIRNVFHAAEFELEVSYLASDGSWKDLEGATELFQKEALYEPGYVEVVYLRAKNAGDLLFLMQGAVSVVDYTVAYNQMGQAFHLQDYLRFGLLMADDQDQPYLTLEALQNAIPNREAAEAIATERLSRYDPDIVSLDAGATAYLALVVRMPKEVDNVANYDKDLSNDPPIVELGVIIKASQEGSL